MIPRLLIARRGNSWRDVALLAATILAGPALGQDLAITNVTLHPAPDAAAINGATILIRDGRIAAVGRSLDTGDLSVLDGEGRVATAGLWNCHVHFTDPALADDPGGVLSAMLLRYGLLASWTRARC